MTLFIHVTLFYWIYCFLLSFLFVSFSASVWIFSIELSSSTLILFSDASNLILSHSWSSLVQILHFSILECSFHYFRYIHILWCFPIFSPVFKNFFPFFLNILKIWFNMNLQGSYLLTPSSGSLLGPLLYYVCFCFILGIWS